MEDLQEKISKKRILIDKKYGGINEKAFQRKLMAKFHDFVNNMKTLNLDSF